MRNSLLNKIVFLFGVLRGGLQGRKLGVRGALKKRFGVFGRLRVIRENGVVDIGKYVKFYPNVKISVLGNEKSAMLKIGEYSAIGDRTEIHCGDCISIGAHTLISWDCCIMDRDYHALEGVDEKNQYLLVIMYGLAVDVLS